MRRPLTALLCAVLGLSAAHAQTYRPGFGFGRPGFQFLSAGGACPNASLAYYDFVANTGCSAGTNAANSVANLTVSRASIGYDLAATTQFAANVARRTGAGLLVEGAGTNLLFPSNPPSTLPSYSTSATWYTGGGTWTPNNATAPDGTTTAGTHSIPANTQGIAYQNGGSATANVSGAWFVKGTAGQQVYFHADQGTGTRNRTLLTFTGGWDRVKAAQSSVRFLFLTTQDLVGSSPLPAVTFQVWQATFEQAAAPTSLIPTTTASATRAADNITLTLPSGTTKVDLAYDNSTISTVTVSAGSYTIPANPAGTNLKSLRAY